MGVTQAQKRGIVIADLTRFKTYLASPDIDIVELQARLERIQTKLNEFKVIQAEIESGLEGDLLKSQYNEREYFENMYFSVLKDGRKNCKN